MPKYKVLAEFELDGAAHAVDSEVELSEEVAASLVAEGKVELVVEGGESSASVDESASGEASA